jgi:hypothetical protein
MKKLIGIASGIGLMLVAITPAFAQTIESCGNDTTGYDSNNWCVKVAAKAALFKTKNKGFTVQSVFNKVNTGGNKADKNTNSGEYGGVMTGTGKVTTVKSASLNHNSVTLDQSACGENCLTGDVVAGNSITGAKSTNVAAVVDIKAVAFEATNEGFIMQNVTNRVNTGNNSASMNTIGGTVVTGNGVIENTVVSDMNKNTIVIHQ